MKRSTYTYICITVLSLWSVPHFSHALLPPDLIFSAGIQLVQFFTIIAVAVGGIFSGGLMFFRTRLFLSWQQLWFLVAFVMFVVLVAVAGVFLSESRAVALEHAQQVQHLEEGIRQVGLACQQQVRKACAVPLIESSDSAELYPAYKTFFSDAVTLFAFRDNVPFVMQLDINRRQDAPGLFTQYAFLDGVVHGKSFDEYTSARSSYFDVVSDNFIVDFSRELPQDLSTRDTYSGEIVIDGSVAEYTIEGVVGDFVSRNHPSYTRHQSVGIAQVTYDGEAFEAYALVEDMFADDYRNYVFFDGYHDVVATTHQFILWDEEGSFYMIDQSVVTSDTPKYPSHTWVLHKGSDGATRKVFEADIQKNEKDGQSEWNVTLPFNGSTNISLSNQVSFQDEKDRKRMVVQGTVTDEYGSRNISGILLIVQ